MPRTIVWATDGSDYATRALRSANALLHEDGAMLVAVHVIREAAPSSRDGASHSVDLVDRLQTLVADMADQGLNAALKVIDHLGSQPARAIADIAREIGADVIVVGTRGLSPLGGVVGGSVTQHLLHIAPCPVLAVPPASHGSTVAPGREVTQGAE